jgi:hypothetical protein
MTSDQHRVQPGRSVLVIGGLVVLLIAPAVVAVLLLDAGKPATYAPDSPEAAFQHYYQAFQNGDTHAAYESFTRRVQGQISYDEFSWNVTQFGQPSGQNTLVRVDRVDRQDQRAVLYLSVEHVSGSGLNISRYSEQRRISLIREDDSWKIDEPLVGVEPGYFGPPKATPPD